MNTNTVVITKNGAPYDNYDDAYAALVRFTRHMDGQIVSVLYRVDDAQDPVKSIMAVGTKNWEECGPQGQFNPDVYLNKFYPLSSYPYGPCGPEFFDLMNGGSCPCPGPSPDPSKQLHNTAFLIRGNVVVTANQNGSNEAVTDPFELSQLDADFTRTNQPTIPVVPGKKSDEIYDTEFDLNGETVVVANQNGQDEIVSNVFELNHLPKYF